MVDKQEQKVSSSDFKMQGDSDTYEFMIYHMNKIADIKMRLIKETQELLGRQSMMLSSPDQGEHMQFLVKQTKAKKGIEVGTFTGYSALCFALALPEDGNLITIDVVEETGKIAKKYWEEAGVAKKIT